MKELASAAGSPDDEPTRQRLLAYARRAARMVGIRMSTDAPHRDVLVAAVIDRILRGPAPVDSGKGAARDASDWICLLAEGAEASVRAHRASGMADKAFLGGLPGRWAKSGDEDSPEGVGEPSRAPTEGQRPVGVSTPSSSRAAAMESLPRAEIARILDQAIARLEPRYREVILLRDVACCTWEGIAGRMSLESEPAACMLHARARNTLLREIRDDLGGGMPPG